MALDEEDEDFPPNDGRLKLGRLGRDIDGRLLPLLPPPLLPLPLYEELMAFIAPRAMCFASSDMAALRAE